MTDQRMNPDLIHDILDVLDRHGYARADDEHTGRAIWLISDLAHIYEGAQDHPFGPYINQAPRSKTQPSPSEPAAQDAVPVPADQVKTLLAALDIAADDKRDRAAACADCTTQSCPTCQSRLQHARAHDRIAAHLIQTTEASAAATVSHPGSAASTAKQPVTRHRTAPTRSGDAVKQPEDSDSRRAADGRPPEYVVVLSASDWVKEHFPAAGANLWDALHTGKDRHRDPEPDLEAEP